MIKTQYGTIPISLTQEYKSKLIGKVFKILPLKEEDCNTWQEYICSVLFELIGYRELVEEMQSKAEFMSLLNILESLKYENDIKIIKKEVFNCLDLIKKL